VKKRKFNKTRKHKAIVRTAIAAALIALAVGMNLYGLFPTNGLRLLEESYGTGKTEVVAKTFEKAVFSEIYLTENENVLMLAASRFGLLGGWCDLGAAVMDKDPDAVAVEAGYWGVCDFDSDVYIYYVFGRVLDENIDVVCAGVMNEQETSTIGVSTGEFIEKDGGRYFLIKVRNDGTVKANHVVLEGFDSGSRLIFESKVEQRTYTSTKFSWLNDF